MYTCVGTNMVGERDSDPAELTVFGKATQAFVSFLLLMSQTEVTCVTYQNMRQNKVNKTQ